MSSGRMETKANPIGEIEAARIDEKNMTSEHNEILGAKDLLTDAYKAEGIEHDMGMWEAMKTHPMACFWAFIMAFTIVNHLFFKFYTLPLWNYPPSFFAVTDTPQVMESFDMFLNGNFVALPAFQERFGVFIDGKWVIPTRWQSALFQSGQCGAFVGVFAAGPVTNRLGYRMTTIIALVIMNATIFISFFVSPSLQKFRPSQDLTDWYRPHLCLSLRWASFSKVSPAFCCDTWLIP